MKLPSRSPRNLDVLRNYFSKVQIADKDADLDRDPYDSAAWNGDSFSNGATGTIDWVVAFGLPEIPKMVFVWSQVRDSGSAAGDYYIDFKAKVTTTRECFRVRCTRTGNDHFGNAHGVIPVADNGTSYYSVTASGVNTMDVWLFVIAWVK